MQNILPAFLYDHSYCCDMGEMVPSLPKTSRVNFEKLKLLGGRVFIHMVGGIHRRDSDTGWVKPERGGVDVGQKYFNITLFSF